MEVGDEIIYKRRIIYFNMWGEFCVCHMYGGMVCYNAGFDSVAKAKEYIDRIVHRRDLMRDDFERIANEVKKVDSSIPYVEEWVR